jgi:hypothetical protein
MTTTDITIEATTENNFIKKPPQKFYVIAQNKLLFFIDTQPPSPTFLQIRQRRIISLTIQHK